MAIQKKKNMKLLGYDIGHGEIQNEEHHLEKYKVQPEEVKNVNSSNHCNDSSSKL